MARDRRWIDVAVEAVMELSCTVETALADGQVDEREAQTTRSLCREALLLVERADIAERIAAAYLRTNGDGDGQLLVLATDERGRRYRIA